MQKIELNPKRAGPEQNQERPAKDRNYPITAGSAESFSPHDHMNLIRLLRVGRQICFSRTTPCGLEDEKDFQVVVHPKDVQVKAASEPAEPGVLRSVDGWIDPPDPSSGPWKEPSIPSSIAEAVAKPVSY
jgi:hypothetical protein